MNHKLCRLKCNDVQYYLLTSDKDEGLDLLLTDTVSAWHGHDGRESLSADNVDTEDYEMQTRNALLGEFVNSFEYELKESSDKDDNSLQLIWKKVVEKDRIKFQLGSLSMKPVMQFNAALSTMFNRMIDANSELRQQLVELKADCDRLAADRADALKKLEECVNIKEETEKDLYAKFAVVLNDKKAKIRHLKAELEAAEVSASGVVDEAKQKRRAARISASVAEQEQLETLDLSKQESTPDKKGTDTETQDSQVSDVAAVAACSKKATDAKSSHVLDFMLEEPGATADEDLPAGPKRSKPANGNKQQPGTSDYCRRVPLMQSMTGTTDTKTTSLVYQRSHDKDDKSDKHTESKVSTQSKPSRSADLDELLDDMA